jgi:hypothetical protein
MMQTQWKKKISHQLSCCMLKKKKLPKKNRAPNHSASSLVANPPPSRILTVSCLASRSSLPQNHKLVTLITSVFPARFNFLNPEPKRSDFRPPHNRSQAIFKVLGIIQS